MSLTPDTITAILMFLGAVLTGSLTIQGLVPPNLVPIVTLLILVDTAALGAFFGIKQPIAKARAALAAATKKS